MKRARARESIPREPTGQPSGRGRLPAILATVIAIAWPFERASGEAFESWSARLLDRELPWRALYLEVVDLDGDGDLDIATGGWWYENPGDIRGEWIQRAIGDPFYNFALAADFDGDGDVDLLGTEGRNEGDTTPDSPVLLWAENDGSATFTIHENLPLGQGPFIGGIALGRFQAQGRLQVALSWNGGESGSSGVELLTVPDDPVHGEWSIEEIHPTSEGEALSAGDIDRDGDLDLFQGSLWLRNDGGTFTQFRATSFPRHVDRNRLGDIDGDGDLDAAVGFLFNSTPLHWLENPGDPTGPWTLRTIADRIGGGLSLDLADLDDDGDLDVILGEHRGATRLLVFENGDGGKEWQA
ncbi:MAG TPA: FG-GAP-like repeat-containing protein, partial [Planctomycetota bacterium]|nr:FG-GAP-like repeat-containing protein [Planctomycetota bacterium]